MLAYNQSKPTVSCELGWSQSECTRRRSAGRGIIALCTSTSNRKSGFPVLRLFFTGRKSEPVKACSERQRIVRDGESLSAQVPIHVRTEGSKNGPCFPIENRPHTPAGIKGKLLARHTNRRSAMARNVDSDNGEGLPGFAEERQATRPMLLIEPSQELGSEG